MENPTLDAHPKRQVAVIGGGIAGLAAAQRLGEVDPQAKVTLFEATGRLGGVLQTESHGGYLIEHAADMFIAQPAWAVELCERVGLGDELISTDDRFRRAFVVRRGKLVRVPDGFALLQPARIWPLVKTPLLSWQGKLRLAMEYFVPRPRNPTSSAEPRDESLASFARRRMGREAFDRLIQPLVGGIYTADPEKLSLAATLPRFLQMETEYRSLMRAAWQQRKAHGRMRSSPSAPASGARYGMFVAPRHGMKALVDAVTRTLGGVEVRLNTAIERLEQADGGRWFVHSSQGPSNDAFDAVILATSAPVAAGLLEPLDANLAADLCAIEYASTAIVCLGYRRAQITHPLDGFGFVVPAIEQRKILAASFASVKFAGRALSDRVLIRIFIGGALQPELVDHDDDELLRIARQELAELLGVDGEPELVRVLRWRNAMPQYHLGHLARVVRIMAQVGRLRTVALAGSAYNGVGIPHCIHSGRQAADQVANAMAR